MRVLGYVSVNSTIAAAVLNNCCLVISQCPLHFQLADWWEEMAYWSKRNSLVVHSNVSAGGPPSPCGDRETYAK